MRVIIFQGFGGSGKTTIIELLTRALTAEGARVGTIKHIHEATFSIDSPGKDTWRHARAGATQVMALAPREIAIIRRRETSQTTVEEILGYFRGQAFDFVLVEGLHRLFAGRRGISRVICARNEEEAIELLGNRRDGVIFVAGRVAEAPSKSAKRRRVLAGIPMLSLPRDIGAAMALVAGKQPSRSSRIEAVPRRDRRFSANAPR